MIGQLLKIFIDKESESIKTCWSNALNEYDHSSYRQENDGFSKWINALRKL
jgi:hypothetical protein